MRPDATCLVVDERGRVRWWTFAGWRANLWLARAAADLRRDLASIDDPTVALDPEATLDDLRHAIADANVQTIDLRHR